MDTCKETTDATLPARLRAHAAGRADNWHEVENAMRQAADVIELLSGAVMSVQRSAFDAGYDAGKDGRVREWAYKDWSNT